MKDTRVNILIVDDRRANLLALEAILEPLGSRVIQAESGEEALRCLLHEDFAVILLDVQMSGLDGFETARLIKQRERCRHVPILFLTAINRDDVFIDRGYSEGAVDYLVKPLNASILRSKVRCFVDLYRRERAVQQQEAELQQAQAKARVQTMFMRAPALLCVLRGPEHRIEIINPLAASLFAEPPQEGEPLTSAVPSDLASGMLAVLNRTLKSNEPCRFEEVRFTDPSTGVVRYFSGIIEPTHDPARSVDGLTLFGFDVTEQVLTRQRLSIIAESAQRVFSSLNLRDSLPALANLVVERLADTCVIDLLTPESKLEELAFASRQPRALRSATEAVHDPTELLLAMQRRRAQVFSHVPQSFEPHSTWSLLDHYRAQTMAVVPILFQDRPLGTLTAARGPGGAPFDSADVVVLDEIAARAALAIENSRLYREAQEAIRVRDDFLSVASHELKTPLTPLTLRLQSFSKSIDNDEVLSTRHGKDIEVLRRQVKRLADLVTNLLDVSRIRGGRLELETETVDLSGLVRDLGARFEPEAERAGSKMHITPTGPVEGQWDRLRLEQVITNLLSNALKYGAGKPIQVSVNTERENAYLQVLDEGIGIDPREVPRIFNPFERAVSDRHYGGLGLGLYVTRQIVEAMGGTISVESEPGRGSCFSVVLPLTQRDPGPGASPQ